MTEAEQIDVLLSYLATNVVGKTGVRLSADSSLIKSGLIDSFALVDVLAKLEDVTNLRIPASKVQPKDMETVTLMLATARRVGKPR
jgi:acyl carrier protein